MKHLRLRVSGRVQDVFFRDNTKAYADEHGIKGFVRNEPDGTVLLEAEGEDWEIDRLLDWLEKSPGGSWVSKIDTETAEPCGFDSFEVRR